MFDWEMWDSIPNVYAECWNPEVETSFRKGYHANIQSAVDLVMFQMFQADLPDSCK